MKVDVNGTSMDVRVLFTEKEIKVRVETLATQINRDLGQNELVVVLVVLHGALLFAADLVRGLSMPTHIESIRLRSYEGTQSTGHVELISSLPNNIKNAHVLVVEDIIDSGRSMVFMRTLLQNTGAKSVRIATLLDKPQAHEVPVDADYVGFSIGRNFVIGYGLDLDGNYRNLPYVAELLPVLKQNL